MRLLALSLSIALAGPPVEGPINTEPEPVERLDCMPDDCESEPTAEPEPELEATAEPEPEPQGPSAEDLKLEGKGLIASGEYAEGIAVLQQAYNLAPEDHIIAYDIASAAERMRDCGKMKIYLDHFIKYADPAEFPNKLEKAKKTLQSGKCVSAAGREVMDASRAVSSKAPAGAGDGLTIGGALMIGAGILAFVGGLTMVIIGLQGTKDAATRLDVSDLEKHRNLTIGGGITGPAGVVFVIGGSVMVARGQHEASLTLTPTGLSVRF